MMLRLTPHPLPVGGTGRASSSRRNVAKRVSPQERPDPANMLPHDVRKELDSIMADFKSDPEVMAQLQEVREAAQKVAQIKAARAELDRAEAAASSSERSQAQDAAERGAAAEVTAAAGEVAAALQELEAATAARDAAIAAQSGQYTKWTSDEIDEAAEKVESGKAAVLAAVGGTLGCAPLVLLATDSVLQLGVDVGAVALSCALFGVTYRYAVRKDLGNTQLKGGVGEGLRTQVGAFGLVRGVAQVELLLSSQGFSVDSVAVSALAAGESVLAFGFAAAALEYAFQKSLLRPFGTAGEKCNM